MKHPRAWWPGRVFEIVGTGATFEVLRVHTLHGAKRPTAIVVEQSRDERQHAVPLRDLQRILDDGEIVEVIDQGAVEARVASEARS